MFAWYVPIAASERFILPLLVPLLSLASEGIARATGALRPGVIRLTPLVAGTWVAIWVTLTCVSGTLGERLGSASPDAAPIANSADARAQCFGIPNDFSGKLPPEREQHIPKPLRGAFYIESVHDITTDELAERLRVNSQLAEEVRDGNTYVAVEDFRDVEFGNGVSGMMIVIERYRIVDRPQ